MNTTRVMMALWAMMGLLLMLRPGVARDRPKEGTPPSEAGPVSYHWQHVRMDEGQLKKLGDGSFEKGLNNLGERGFVLFIVTHDRDTGQPGFHYFKRPPSKAPIRPHYQYLRIDTGGLVKLGKGEFMDGMSSIEKDGWELISVTSTKSGSVGFHYFMRLKR